MDGTMLLKSQLEKIIFFISLQGNTAPRYSCQSITEHPSPWTEHTVATGEGSAEAGPTHGSAGLN